jgi:hypothetical protein
MIGSIFIIIMERNMKQFWDQIHIIVWFIIVVLIFIFCLAVINGNGCGYKNSLIAHGVLGLLVGGCLVILLAVCIAMSTCIDIILRGKRLKRK